MAISPLPDEPAKVIILSPNADVLGSLRSLLRMQHRPVPVRSHCFAISLTPRSYADMYGFGQPFWWPAVSGPGPPANCPGRIR